MNHRAQKPTLNGRPAELKRGWKSKAAFVAGVGMPLGIAALADPAAAEFSGSLYDSDASQDQLNDHDGSTYGFGSALELTEPPDTASGSALELTEPPDNGFGFAIERHNADEQLTVEETLELLDRLIELEPTETDPAADVETPPAENYVMMNRQNPDPINWSPLGPDHNPPYYFDLKLDAAPIPDKEDNIAAQTETPIYKVHSAFTIPELSTEADPDSTDNEELYALLASLEANAAIADQLDSRATIKGAEHATPEAMTLVATRWAHAGDRDEITFYADGSIGRNHSLGAGVDDKPYSEMLLRHDGPGRAIETSTVWAGDKVPVGTVIAKVYVDGELVEETETIPGEGSTKTTNHGDYLYDSVSRDTDGQVIGGERFYERPDGRRIIMKLDGDLEPMEGTTSYRVDADEAGLGVATIGRIDVDATVDKYENETGRIVTYSTEDDRHHAETQDGYGTVISTETHWRTDEEGDVTENSFADGRPTIQTATKTERGDRSTTTTRTTRSNGVITNVATTFEGANTEGEWATTHSEVDGDGNFISARRIFDDCVSGHSSCFNLVEILDANGNVVEEQLKPKY